MRNRKEAVVALVLVAALATSARAQGVASIGLTASGGLARFTSHAQDSLIGYRLGWSAGLYAGVPLGGGFALQPELVFSRKGAVDRIDLGTTQETVERTYTAYYVELPLLVRYDVPVAPAIAPFVIGGPAPAYLVRATNVAGEATPEDMTDQLSTLDIAAVLGAGARYATPFGTARLSARASYSLGDIDRSGAPEQIGRASANRNVTFAIVAGFEVMVF